MQTNLKMFRRRAGFSLVELLIAMVISTAVAAGLMSIMIMGTRLDRSVLRQQMSLYSGKKVTERLNREIRLASNNIKLLTPVANQSNEVQFNYFGETGNVHAFRLNSGDGDFTTANDNEFVYDPDVHTDGDEQVICRMITSIDNMATGRCFTYTGNVRTPLQIRLRVGDPVVATALTGMKQGNDQFTGRGLQGCDININVTPRNPAS